MTFNNSGTVPQQYNNLGNVIASINRMPLQQPPKNLPLHAPMVDRIHKAKPGCSACGKKVA